MSDPSTIICSWFALAILNFIFSFTVRTPLTLLNQLLSKNEILLLASLSGFTRLAFNLFKILGIRPHFIEPQNNIFATCVFTLIYLLLLSQSFVFEGLDLYNLVGCLFVLRTSVVYWMNVSIDICLEAYFSRLSPKQDYALYYAFYYLGFIISPIMVFFLEAHVDFETVCKLLIIPLLIIVIIASKMKKHKRVHSHPSKVKGIVHNFSKHFPLFYGNFAFSLCVSYFYPLLVLNQMLVKDVFFILSLMGYLLGLGLGGVCTDKFQMRKMLIYLSKIVAFYSMTVIHRTQGQEEYIFLTGLGFIFMGFCYGTHLATSYGEAHADGGTKQWPTYLLNIAQSAGSICGIYVAHAFMNYDFWSGSKANAMILGGGLLVHIFLHFIEEDCQKKLRSSEENAKETETASEKKDK